MPPGIPLFIPLLASVFAIVVVKESFGGLGRNWMNPAAAGRIFALFSWTAAMGRWTAPLSAAGTAPPPLVFLGSLLAEKGAPRGDPLDILNSHGYPFSALDSSVITWLNAHLLGPLGLSARRGWFDLLLGNTSGPIGEGAVLLLLAGAGYLLARRFIRWEIPVVFLAAFSLLVWTFGGLAAGGGAFAGNVGFHLLTGGTVLAAFYMATDPVTSPLTRRARLVYAAGMGGLAFLLRAFSALPETMSLAIILANCTVPLLDTWRRR